MTGDDEISEVMLQRVRNEYLEMPGLRLTCKQAQRMWGLDEPTCLRVLEFLVDTKFLQRAAHGAYSRLIDRP
jgi:Fic family protein